MEPTLNVPPAETIAIQRVTLAGFGRGLLGSLIGCGLWLGALMAYVSGREGSASEGEIFAVMLLSGACTLLPSILSQMTRGHWVIEESGVRERIMPLVSFLPFGLQRERQVKWADVESFELKEIRLRGDRPGKRRVRRYLRVMVSGQPAFEIPRKEDREDVAFERFAAELSHRLGQR